MQCANTQSSKELLYLRELTLRLLELEPHFDGQFRPDDAASAMEFLTQQVFLAWGERRLGKLQVVYFELINRMRALKALPWGTLKVPYCGESTSLLTIAGFWLSVMFSIRPRKPK